VPSRQSLHRERLLEETKDPQLKPSEQSPSSPATITEAAASSTAGGEVVQSSDPGATTALEAFLPAQDERAQASAEDRSSASARRAGLVSAKVVDLRGRSATVQLRGEDGPLDVELDPDVDAAVVAEALENGDRVMVEAGEAGELVLVGVLRCRLPEKLKISAERIELEAEREVVIRSGRAALRLREDGEIDLIGSRISAASRGLFRLVGRMLRLN
jgi:hypothetical protein